MDYPCLHGVRVQGGDALTREPNAPFDRTLSLTQIATRPIARSPLAHEFAYQRAAELEYSFGFEGDDYLLRFPGMCEFKLARATLDMQLAIDPAESLEIAGMLFVNAVLSAVLGLDGAVVLHAAAVAFGPESLLIAGPSGMGKTTVATVLCAGGARLVSDDAVRIIDVAGIQAFPGTSELRVRAGAEPLLEGRQWPMRRLADERLSVIPELCRSMTEVRAIWCPRVADVVEPVAQRTHGANALVTLTSSLRTAWAPQFAAPLLKALTRIASSVPVVDVLVPSTLIERAEQQAALLRLAQRQLTSSDTLP